MRVELEIGLRCGIRRERALGRGNFVDHLVVPPHSPPHQERLSLQDILGTLLLIIHSPSLSNLSRRFMPEGC